MGVDDIQGPSKDIPASRLTLQRIGNVSDRIFFAYLPNNNPDACQPDNANAWPPALILDFFYGCAALKAWGPKPFMTFVENLNFDDYYGAEAKSGESGDEGSEEGDTSRKEMDRRERYRARKKKRDKEERQRRHDEQEEDSQDEFGEVMDLVMGLWTRHARESQPEQGIARGPNVDHSQQEKVEAWLASSEGIPRE